MFYLTSKFPDNRVNNSGFIEGGEGLLKPPPSPPLEAQELRKSPGGIGLMLFSKCNFINYAVVQQCKGHYGTI